MRGTAWFLAGATLLFLAAWLAPAQWTSAGLADYVPLHTFMETFAIVVSMLIFGVAWNAYSGERPGNVLILACGFLAVGLIDFAHVISFPGMPDFVTPAGLEKAINFWLAARLLAAGTLLLIALRRWRPLPTLAARTLLFAGSVALTGLVYWIGLYHADLLPRTFVAGKGLTPFKVGAEYFIIAVLAAAAWFFLRHARRRGSFSALCLFAACSVSVLSELCFTLFSDVADLFNVLGHVYKIAAYALIYRAVFVDSVRSPFERLARARQEIERAGEELRRVNVGLEQRVAERTADLEQANIGLRDSAARFRAIRDTVVDGIITIDERGIVETVNPAAERIFGYAAAEVIGNNVKMLMPEPYHGKHDGYLERYRATGEARIIGIGREVVGRRKDGSTFPLDLAVSQMRLGGERHYTGIVRDITERKHAEAEILRKNVELEEANRAKSDFLANMSHELRTPLNSIIGCSEMLKDGVLGELEAKQRGFVTDIFDAGSHLLSLINDILDLSKVEAGMLQLEAAAVDMPALLKASMLVVREKAATRRIRLDTRIDASLGTLLADERKLKQIVYNLLSNAVKFSPEGGTVTLSARRCARAEVAFDAAMPARLIALPPGEDGEFLAITVEDSGEGLAEEYLPKLFEPFTQVDSSVARRHAGTGLGLSLVRRLAELHGGTVGVASRPGTGSRFCVWLPWREAAAVVREGEMAVAETAASAPEARTPAARAVPLALVIEDDDAIADLIIAELRAEGFEVMRAATGEEGLVRAAKSRPQLITLDMFLPAMDGWEFMRRLKSDPNLADTPVVIISRAGEQSQSLALGARRVLQKPFVREELMAALAGLIGARSDGEAPQVLVVDDNVKAVDLVATVLQNEGYRVLRAYGGAEAIEGVRRARPDLVILDLMMPEVSGFEVARALRESEHTADIPILVLTAKDLNAEDRARLKSRVSVILEKANFNPSALLAEVRRAMPRRDTE